MIKSGMWNWQYFGVCFFLALLMLAGAWAFWAHRKRGDLTSELLLQGGKTKPLPVSYQTLTTTLNAGDANDTASELAWNWRYDDEDRLIEVLGPGGVTTRITYTSAPPKPGGMTNSEQRITARDAHGRLLSAEGPSGKMAFIYDPSGLHSEVRSDDAPPLRYTYDAFGRLSKMQIGEGHVIQYLYDYLGRPSAIATPAGDIRYSYNMATNTVLRRLPNGVQSIRRYNDEGPRAGAHRHN
jgi:uncharacterized protein RhaS with RHS repeats